MIFSYFDALSGCPLLVDLVGHVRSPKLKELYPSGIGYRTYNMYLHLLSMKREEMLKYADAIGYRDEAEKSNNLFEFAIQVKDVRDLLCEIFSFFLLENVAWFEDFQGYLVFEEVDGVNKNVGFIQSENYENLRLYILQMNYRELDQDTPLTFASPEAREKWEKAMAFVDRGAPNEMDVKRMDIGNMVSKLCSLGNGYTLLNISDLTVFQLYDQFSQAGYLRSSNLSESVFSNHGGDKFNFADWLNPVNQF